MWRINIANLNNLPISYINELSPLILINYIGILFVIHWFTISIASYLFICFVFDGHIVDCFKS